MDQITHEVEGGIDHDLMAQMIEAGLMEAPKTVVEEVPAEIISETLETIIDADELAAEAKADDTRKEIYAAMSAKSEMVDEETIANEPTPVAPVVVASKKARTPATPKTPRETRGTTTEYLTSLVGAQVQLVEGETPVDIDALVACMPAKKVQEKLVNFFDHVYKAAPLSVYTKIAVDILRDEGELSAKSLADGYMAATKKSGAGGYSLGTARSQAQQQISLLNNLHVALRSGANIVPMPGSVYWDKLTT